MFYTLLKLCKWCQTAQRVSSIAGSYQKIKSLVNFFTRLSSTPHPTNTFNRGNTGSRISQSLSSKSNGFRLKLNYGRSIESFVLKFKAFSETFWGDFMYFSDFSWPVGKKSTLVISSYQCNEKLSKELIFNCSLFELNRLLGFFGIIISILEFTLCCISSGHEITKLKGLFSRILQSK